MSDAGRMHARTYVAPTPPCNARAFDAADASPSLHTREHTTYICMDTTHYYTSNKREKENCATPHTSHNMIGTGRRTHGTRRTSVEVNAPKALNSVLLKDDPTPIGSGLGHYYASLKCAHVSINSRGSLLLATDPGVA